MITLSEFVRKYSGQHVEVGGSPSALNQCVDLANAYIEEVLGLPKLLATNAVDFPEKIGGDYQFIENAADNFPVAGDVIVFKQYGTRYGSPGHIAVVLEANKDSVTMFEQNYPTGSVCATHTRNYLGCRGWLRCLSNNYYRGYDLTNKDSMRVAVDVLCQLVAGDLKTRKEYETLQEQISALEKSQKDLSKRLTKLEGTIASKNETILELQSGLETANEEKTKAEELLEEYKPYKGWYENALKTIPSPKYVSPWDLIAEGLRRLLNNLKHERRS